MPKIKEPCGIFELVKQFNGEGPNEIVLVYWADFLPTGKSKLKGDLEDIRVVVRPLIQLFTEAYLDLIDGPVVCIALRGKWQINLYMGDYLLIESWPVALTCYWTERNLYIFSPNCHSLFLLTSLTLLQLHVYWHRHQVIKIILW